MFKDILSCFVLFFILLDIIVFTEYNVITLELQGVILIDYDSVIMIRSNNVISNDKLQMLIEYKFDFEKLMNVYDNAKYTNGLINLCIWVPSYDHCKTFTKCTFDITHCDITRRNALFWAAATDINTFKYLLSNKYFSNDDEMIVDTFKLLKQHKFNFDVYHYYGRLPIHNACIENCFSLLSWMIDENIFDIDINCKTKYSRNVDNYNGDTPLDTAVECNSVECVDMLCKRTTMIDITTQDIYLALENDNVEILKFLVC